MTSSEFELNLSGHLQLLEENFLKTSLDEAVRTVVRNILLLVFEQRFQQQHPSSSLPDVVNKLNSAKKYFLKNRGIMSQVDANDKSKFDASTLYHLIRFICGPYKDKSWNKEKDTLPGHIERLHCVRNLVSHQVKPTKEELIIRWETIVRSSKEVLMLSGNEDRVPEFVHQLEILLSILDKVIMELQKDYESKEKSTLKPLLWAGVNFEFHKHVTKTYTPTTITLNDDSRNARDVTSDDILSDFRSGTIILQGESGTGKTSLLRYLTSLWKASKFLKNIDDLNAFDLVLFLDCDCIKVKIPTLKIIMQEMLPQTTSAAGFQRLIGEISKENLKVLFLIDAFDERVTYLADIFKELQRKFRHAKFLIATRPHCSAKIKSLCITTVSMATIKGFDYLATKSFVRNILSILKSVEKKPEDFLAWISNFPEVKKIPQLLCWSLFLWLNDKNLIISCKWRLYKELTDFMIKKLCIINNLRIMATALPNQGQLWLDAVSGVAYKSVLKNDMVLAENSQDLQSLISTAKTLEFRDPYEAISSLMHSQSSIAGAGEILQFQFHHTHVEYLVAHHITQSLERKSRSPMVMAQNMRSIPEKQLFIILNFVLNIASFNASPNGNLNPETLLFVAENMSYFFQKESLNEILSLIDCCPNKEEFLHILEKKLKEKFGRNQCSVWWIRSIDVAYSDSLKVLLKYFRPDRLWANLGKIDISLPDANRKKESVNDFLDVLRKAFGIKLLVDLTISHGRFDRLTTFNQNLSWLTLVGCEFTEPFKIPKTLMKLNIKSSSGLKYIDIPKQVESLLFEGLSEDLPKIPVSVKFFSVNGCAEVTSLQHLSNLETLVIKNCDAFPLPPSLKKLKCYNSSLSIFELIQPCVNLRSIYLSFAEGLFSLLMLSETGSFILDKTLSTIQLFPHLESISVKGIDASSEEVYDFVLSLSSIDSLRSSRLKILLTILSSIDDFLDVMMQESFDHIGYISLGIKFANKSFGSNLQSI